jgi:hypothetical protein
MPAASGLWPSVSAASHVAGACAAITVAISVWGQRQRYVGAGWAIITALGMTALWCLSVAVEGELSLIGQGMLGLRNLAYLLAIYRMFASDGRHTSIAQVGPVMAVLALVDILVPAIQFVEQRLIPAAHGCGRVAGAGAQSLRQRVEQFAAGAALACVGAGRGVGVRAQPLYGGLSGASLAL